MHDLVKCHMKVHMHNVDFLHQSDDPAFINLFCYLLQKFYQISRAGFPTHKAMLTLPDLTLPFNNAHKFSPLWKLSEKIPPLTFHERVPENNCYITGLEDWSSIIEFHKNHNVSVGFWG